MSFSIEEVVLGSFNEDKRPADKTPGPFWDHCTAGVPVWREHQRPEKIIQAGEGQGSC